MQSSLGNGLLLILYDVNLNLRAATKDAQSKSFKSFHRQKNNQTNGKTITYKDCIQ